MTETKKCWVNGTVQDASIPLYRAEDRGSALGDGLFETIKIEAGQPCYLNAHWERLSASAKVLHLPLPFSFSPIKSALHDLICINGIKDGAARLTVSRGAGPRGLTIPARQNPLMVITTSSGLPKFSQPPVLGLSKIRRNPWSVSSCHKTLSYVDNIAARSQQLSAKMRDDVIMLDCNGHVASTSCANVFWWNGDDLHTPSLDCAILPGTMRARVMDLAQKSGIFVHNGAYKPQAILCARAAFMTNALIGIQGLAGLDFGAEGDPQFIQNHAPTEALHSALMGR